MTKFLFLALVAVVGGLGITLQGQFMGIMDRILGTQESVFITYASGGLLASILMLITRGGNLAAFRQVPWYAFLAGATGLVIVGAIGYTVPRLGLAPAFTIMTASQLALAAAIDHFGLMGATARPLGPSQLAGLGVLLAGVWLTVR